MRIAFNLLFACMVAMQATALHAQVYEAPPDFYKFVQSQRLDTIADPPATVEGAAADSAFSWHALAALGSVLKDPTQMPTFEKLWRKWALPTSKTRDGYPQIIRFENGIIEYFGSVNTWDEYPKQIDALTRAWPNHPIPPLIKAAWHYASGLKARGTGYARTVPKVAFERFEHHMKQTRIVLDQAPATSRDFPLWYNLKMESWADGKAAMDELGETLKQAIAKTPHSPMPYFIAVTHFSPRWFGSFAQVNTLMAWGLKNPLPGTKNEIYTRMAWSFSKSFDEPDVAFQRAGIRWSLMKAGFEEMMQRYPHSLWNLNNFASFACRLNDRATFTRLKESVRVNHIEAAWHDGYSFENCSAMYAKAM